MNTFEQYVNEAMGVDSISKHADALVKAAETRDDEDALKMKAAARAMKNDDFESLTRELKSSDTDQRETIMSFIHPTHWESLGVKPVDLKRAIRDFERSHTK